MQNAKLKPFTFVDFSFWVLMNLTLQRPKSMPRFYSPYEGQSVYSIEVSGWPPQHMAKITWCVSNGGVHYKNLAGTSNYNIFFHRQSSIMVICSSEILIPQRKRQWLERTQLLAHSSSLAFALLSLLEGQTTLRCLSLIGSPSFTSILTPADQCGPPLCYVFFEHRKICYVQQFHWMIRFFASNFSIHYHTWYYSNTYILILNELRLLL